MWRTKRYELALYRSVNSRTVTGEDHAAVIDALERGALEHACDALFRNMTSGYQPIRAWLDRRNGQAK